MRKKVLHIFFFIYLIFIVRIKINAQDPQVSQNFAVAPSLSPAFTGIYFKDNFQFLYRNQFPNSDGSYHLGMMNLNLTLPKIQSGIGLSATYDKQFRNLSTTNIMAKYAYHIILSHKSLLSAGIEAGWQFKTLNPGNYVFPNNTGLGATNIYDPVAASFGYSKNFLDLGAGLLYYTPKIWIGFSTNHINQPNQSLNIGTIDELKSKYSLQIGKKIDHTLSNGTFIQITPILYLKKQGKNMQLDLGTYLNIGKIDFGVWYRGVPMISNSSGFESIIGVFGYSNEIFAIGYSHDFLISGLSGYMQGANEITFSYFFNQDKENMLLKILKKHYKIPCPKF